MQADATANLGLLFSTDAGRRSGDKQVEQVRQLSQEQRKISTESNGGQKSREASGMARVWTRWRRLPELFSFLQGGFRRYDLDEAAEAVALVRPDDPQRLQFNTFISAPSRVGSSWAPQG